MSGLGFALVALFGSHSSGARGGREYSLRPGFCPASKGIVPDAASPGLPAPAPLPSRWDSPFPTPLFAASPPLPRAPDTGPPPAHVESITVLLRPGFGSAWHLHRPPPPPPVRCSPPLVAGSAPAAGREVLGGCRLCQSAQLRFLLFFSPPFPIIKIRRLPRDPGPRRSRVKTRFRPGLGSPDGLLRGPTPLAPLHALRSEAGLTPRHTLF